MIVEQKQKMLITGVSGLLGNNLAYYFQDKYDVLGLYHSFPINRKGMGTKQCDLMDKDKVFEVISDFCPEVLIHCAALANVDQCEKDEILARKLNIDSVENIIQVLEGSNTKFVHISTDNIFNGEKGSYMEGDQPLPVNIYAKTKYAAESIALKFDNTIVARINIFGWNVQNKQSLGEWVLSELQNQNKIKGFVDAIFSSLYTFDLAKLIEAALEKDIKGIYHFAASDSMSKYDFAVEIAELVELDQGLIEPSSVDDFEFTARRPKNLSLNTQKLQGELKIKIPTVKESIQNFSEDFQEGLPNRIRDEIFALEKNGK